MNGSECFEFERILHAKFEAFAQTNSEWLFPLYGTKFFIEFARSHDFEF